MAADMSIPYPGNVNQPDRKDPAWDQYHTFEQQVNHELPDMRHEWQDNPRDEIGFGIPKKSDLTVASVRVAANKAVRIAVLLLGEKVKDAAIEEQARDFMAMSGDSMDRTLARFTATQKLYAEDDEKDEEKKAAKEDDKDEKKAADEKDEEKKAAKEDDKDEKKAADEKDEEKKAAKEDDKEDKKAADEKKDEEKKAAKEDDKEDKKASLIKVLQAALEDLKKDDEKKASDDLAKGKDAVAAKEDDKDEKKAADEKKDEEKKDAAKEDDKDEKKAADEKKDEEKKAAKEDDKDEKKAADEKDEEKKAAKEDDKDEKKAGMNDLDIEMTGADEGELAPDAEADSMLASLFAADEAPAEEVKEEKAAKKAGIKKLGGQPKVASTSNLTTDISSIWNSAPDVSDVFGN